MSVAVSLSLGVSIRPAAGFLGAWVGTPILCVISACLACPSLTLATAPAVVLGLSVTHAAGSIGASARPVLVRLNLAQVRNVKVKGYIKAARAVGNPLLRIALRHVLSKVTARPVVQSTLSIRLLGDRLINDRHGSLAN